MQRVIEIDEETYNEIKKIVANGNEMCFMQTLIVNSTPLPKGHGDLVDKNLITNEIEQAYKNSLSEPFAKLFVEFMTYIDDAPTIIEADKEGL